ncbi:hypothetical protein HGRIS_001557 [Hohenbuehelia grisea]|uniref:Uncharacterized protein n=1 Tax=Hohenbuehelia grisea TaxID=104357 RepID=A0ABR3JQQ5_9AGAR
MAHNLQRPLNVQHLVLLVPWHQSPLNHMLLARNVNAPRSNDAMVMSDILDTTGGRDPNSSTKTLVFFRCRRAPGDPLEEPALNIQMVLLRLFSRLTILPHRQQLPPEVRVLGSERDRLLLTAPGHGTLPDVPDNTRPIRFLRYKAPYSILCSQMALRMTNRRAHKDPLVRLLRRFPIPTIRSQAAPLATPRVNFRLPDEDEFIDLPSSPSTPVPTTTAQSGRQIGAPTAPRSRGSPRTGRHSASRSQQRHNSARSPAGNAKRHSAKDVWTFFEKDGEKRYCKFCQ